jgi:hypothetical protein
MHGHDHRKKAMLQLKEQGVVGVGFAQSGKAMEEAQKVEPVSVVLSCVALSCVAWPGLAWSCRLLSCRVVSCRVVS